MNTKDVQYLVDTLFEAVQYNQERFSEITALDIPAEFKARRYAELNGHLEGTIRAIAMELKQELKRKKTWKFARFWK